MRRPGWRCARWAALAALTWLLPALAPAAEQPARFDTLDVRAVLERQRTALDSLLLPESTTLDTSGATSVSDSLDRGGSAAVQAHRAAADTTHHRQFSLALQPFALTAYQRVDGLRLGMGGEARVGSRLRADVAGAYGFSSYDWQGRGGIEFGRRRGPRLRLAASLLAEPFGPTPAGRSLGAFAFLFGEDRRDYLQRRSFECEIAPRQSDAYDAALTLFSRRDESLTAATDFHLVGGGTPIEDPNPAVTEGTAQGAALRLRLGGERPAQRLTLEAGACGGPAGGDFEYNWQAVQFDLRRAVLSGGLLSLTLEGANTGGSSPLQAASYLGGDANLRGFERLEFAGRQRASLRLEYAFGIDLLARTRLPLLERLHLQFIPFVDAGSTWGETLAAAGSRGTLEGEWRSSVGLGMQRTLWIPGLEALRLDVMRRTDRGQDAWSAWLRVVELEL